jgi:uncharacterized membrane protein YagU involved in acid resistance
MQSRKMSAIETITNVTAGYLVALLSQIIIFPIMGIEASIQENIIIGLWFTIISIIRSYILRRIFNKIKEA